ncbi:MAG: glycosyltransferase family 2 protein [Rhizobiaceae bacterium]|nr:glycosyltransferase family 2 protein [Rhizobiaceae bacterium]
MSVAAETGRRPSLGAILITRDEADNIGECLASLSFCDEIIVVDSGSSDGTVEIARTFGATVYVTFDWPGFGPQKQRALGYATTDWVLSVDADERIPEALRGEILSAIGRNNHAGFSINRLSYFLGAPLRHGGWYPDRILRLARRDKARFSDSIVHERLEIDGSAGSLDAPMIHYSYPGVDDVLRKMRAYALASAAQRRRDGVRGGVGIAIGRSTYAFLKAYVLKAGFLDGRRGFVAATFRAHETFWRYVAAGWETGR